MKVLAQNNDFVFESPLSRLRFFERANGKEVELFINERPTDEMRKYFEGCLVPAFFYSHPRSEWEDFKDAREVLKIEFLPGVRQIRMPDDQVVKVAPSLAHIPKRTFQIFVDSIVEWMIENGMPHEILDSEAYLTWRDTNIMDLVYPPLQRLKEIYDKEKSKAKDLDTHKGRRRVFKVRARKRRAVHAVRKSKKRN